MRRIRTIIGRILEYLLVAIILITLAPSVVGLSRAAFACRPWAKPMLNDLGSATTDAAILKVTDPIQGYARFEDQTYLTMPEWYIIYNADEYANFIAHNPPSRFPYFKVVGQYWQAYVDVCGVIQARYPFNARYTFKLVFAGLTFTTQSMLKGMYEFTLGRVTEWISSGSPTGEEIYAGAVAREYADFLHYNPWYEFPFKEKLDGLWSKTSRSGPDKIRKWERSLSLSAEYGGDALLGGMLHLTSFGTYDEWAERKIFAVAEGVTEKMAGPSFEILDKIGADRRLVFMTRFEPFTWTAADLMLNGMKFDEIAGNDEILVTAIGPQAGDYKLDHGKYLFELPIPTQPGKSRVALKANVPELNLLIDELQKRKDIQLEHIYDY
jgi:hypothetical protein